MPDEPNAAVALLRLRRLLHRAREAAGLTQEGTAAAFGWSTSKVVRIESGQTRPSLPDVWAMLDLYGAADRREQAEQLARNAKQPSWTRAYWDVLSTYDRACIDLEAAATAIDTLAEYTLPELLQTEEYARIALRARPRLAESSELADRYMEAWRRRLRLLDDPPQLRFFVDETTLNRGMDAAMRDRQLDHLLKFATDPQITIRVVPLHAGMCCNASFTVLHLDDPAESLLYMKDLHNGSLIREEDPAEVAYRHRVLDWCDTNALPADTLSEAIDDARRGTYLVRPEHATAR